MPQVNLRTTEQFESDLFEVMSAMRIANKTSAIRFAVHEMAESIRMSERRRVQSGELRSQPLPDQ